MVQALSLILGSSLTLAALPFLRIAYRITPYMRSVSKLIKPGGYVLVTGATDGIGYQFVRSLTSRGIRVIALGRDYNKLQKVEQIQEGIMTQRIDFSEMNLENLDSENYALKIQEMLNGGKLLGIVNCVGTAHFTTYTQTLQSTISTLHKVNINSLHFLLQLNQHLKKKEGTEDKQFFINVSSATARHPFKYSIVYAATKAYISNLIGGFQQQQSQITYLDVQPWFVKTKMIAYQQSWDSVDPQQIAEGSIRVLGRKPACSGCWKHELVDEFSCLWRRQLEKRLQQKMERANRLRKMKAQRMKRKE